MIGSSFICEKSSIPPLSVLQTQSRRTRLGVVLTIAIGGGGILRLLELDTDVVLVLAGAKLEQELIIRVSAVKLSMLLSGVTVRIGAPLESLQRPGNQLRTHSPFMDYVLGVGPGDVHTIEFLVCVSWLLWTNATDFIPTATVDFILGPIWRHKDGLEGHSSWILSPSLAVVSTTAVMGLPWVLLIGPVVDQPWYFVDQVA